MQPDEPNLSIADETPAPIHHNWLYRRVALPVLALLRMGASPEKLAWSIAAGLLIGINPILGSTTILCLAVAFIFRLNVAASQLGNHIVYPLELILVIPFIHVASRIFHTAPMPLSANELLHAAREHPFDLSRQLWLWEWHAFLLWASNRPRQLSRSSRWPSRRSSRLLLSRVSAHKYPVIPRNYKAVTPYCARLIAPPPDRRSSPTPNRSCPAAPSLPPPSAHPETQRSPASPLH